MRSEEESGKSSGKKGSFLPVPITPEKSMPSPAAKNTEIGRKPPDKEPIKRLMI